MVDNILGYQPYLWRHLNCSIDYQALPWVGQCVLLGDNMDWRYYYYSQPFFRAYQRSNISGSSLPEKVHVFNWQAPVAS